MATTRALDDGAFDDDRSWLKRLLQERGEIFAARIGCVLWRLDCIHETPESAWGLCPGPRRLFVLRLPPSALPLAGGSAHNQAEGGASVVPGAEAEKTKAGAPRSGTPSGCTL